MTRIQKDPQHMAAQARAFEEKKQWKRAANAWRRAAKAQPHEAKLWLRASMCEHQAGSPRDARRTLHEALEGSGAQETLREVVEGAPCTAPINASPLRDLWLALAETYLDTQDWGKARRVCEYVVRVLPRDHGAREVLSTALLQDGKIIEATGTMRELLALSPLDPLHRFKLATLLHIQGAHSEAHREFTRVLGQTRGAQYQDIEIEAEETIELLDNLQIRQILGRAGDDFEFGQQLLDNFDDTLQNHDFHLSENGLGSLRQILSDGRPETLPRFAPLLQ